MKYAWCIWIKAIGDKAHASVKVADHVAYVRTLLIISYLATNAFIVAGVVRHW